LLVETLKELLQHLGPLPGTAHFTLKVEAVRSSRSQCPTTSLHGVITQKTMTWIFTTMKTSDHEKRGLCLLHSICYKGWTLSGMVAWAQSASLTEKCNYCSK